jgi:tRNA (guanine-N7-)-methyltransferase
MARRAVKTVASDIDLSSVLKVPDELPNPWSSPMLFGRAAPLELEIGSGKGLFISRAAVQNPAHDFIGIEIGKKYARLCADRILRQKSGNAVMICGDAALVLERWIPNDFLAAVHVYFPDPWWKRAHRKRRILRTEVLQLIESRLMPTGSFHFWTDVEEYFHSALELLVKHTALQGPFDVPERETESELDYRTHFERRTRLHGEQVYRTEFRKP